MFFNLNLFIRKSNKTSFLNHKKNTDASRINVKLLHQLDFSFFNENTDIYRANVKILH